MTRCVNEWPTFERVELTAIRSSALQTPYRATEPKVEMPFIRGDGCPSARPVLVARLGISLLDLTTMAASRMGCIRSFGRRKRHWPSLAISGGGDG